MAFSIFLVSICVLPHVSKSEKSFQFLHQWSGKLNVLAPSCPVWAEQSPFCQLPEAYPFDPACLNPERFLVTGAAQPVSVSGSFGSLTGGESKSAEIHELNGGFYRGWVNVPIKHLPTIGDIISNSWRWCSKSPQPDIFQALFKGNGN